MVVILIQLDKDIILPGLKGETYSEVFKPVYEKMHKKGYVKETYFEAMLKREENFPTGLVFSEGIIGIPHTDVQHCIQPRIGIGFSTKPFPIRRMDDPDSIVQAEGFFMLSVVRPEEQVLYLQKLIETLQRQRVLTTLKASNNAEEIYQTLIEAGM